MCSKDRVQTSYERDGVKTRPTDSTGLDRTLEKHGNLAAIINVDTDRT